jgi:hypothetical protein
LGIGCLVLPGPIGDSGDVVGGLDRFLSRYLNEWPIEASWAARLADPIAVGRAQLMRATMRV